MNTSVVESGASPGATGQPVPSTSPSARTEALRQLSEFYTRASKDESAVAGLPLIAGYELISEIGRGGMGVVYKARQLGLNRTVAIKMVQGGVFADADAQARFRDEAEFIARLRHPHIVQVFAVGTHQSPLGESFGCPYFAEEYVEGGNLAERLAGKPQTPQDAAWFIEIVARAVHYAHEHGIVHRDLKPGNILLQHASESKEALGDPGSTS